MHNHPVAVGVVVSTEDSDGLGRVPVRCPSVGHDASWAQIVTPLIAAAAVVMPEIGDEVLVAFEHGMCTASLCPREFVERPRWTFRRVGTAIRTLATRRRETKLLPGRGVKLPCLSARSQSLVDVAFGSI
jgi:Type VI secretion system/phage-baseplate injector OB domain